MDDTRMTELMREVTEGKLTRRSVLKRAAALGLSAPAIAALLAACGGGGGGGATATTGTTGGGPTATTGTTGGASPTAAASPGTSATGNYTGSRGAADLVKVLYWQAPTILNPHFSQGTKDSSAAHPVLEPLADFDKDGNLVPVLAAEIPSLDNGGVSSDAKTVTWKLKQGVKWSDGQPFTADDVVFTWQYIVDPKANTTTVASYKPIDKVEAVDQYTVRITFKEPNPAWANVFTTGFGGQILPKHILQNSMGEKAANDPYNLKPIGTGPYKIEEFRPGDVVVYTMNENYREPDKPFFKRLELKGGGDATSAARAAVQTGDTDFAWNLQVEEQVLKSLETAGGPGVIEVIPGPDVERILVNMTDPNKEVDGERSSLKAPHPFQSDLEVRKAYALLCDRDAIAAIYGRAGKPTSNVQTMPPRSASKNTSWKFDVEAAKKQLDSAGWAMQGNVRAKNGVQMKILYQTTVNSVRQKTQEIVKKAFEQAGIQVELKSIDSKVFFDSSPGNPDTAAHFYADIEMFTNSSSSPYPIDYMSSWWGDPSNIAQKSNGWSGNNYERWQNAEYDKLYDQARKEPDTEKFYDLIIQMNDLVVNNVVSIPLVSRGQVSARNKDLKNTNLSPWTTNLWNVASWQK